MLPTFNRVTRNRYHPPIAKVYGYVRGVPFWQSFKTMEAASRCAAQFNGIVFNIR